MRAHLRSTTAFLALLSVTVAATAAISNAAMVQRDQRIRDYSRMSTGAAAIVGLARLSLSGNDVDHHLLHTDGAREDGALGLNAAPADREFARLSDDPIGLPAPVVDAAVSVPAVRHGAIVFDFDANQSLDKIDAGQRAGNIQLYMTTSTSSGFGDSGSVIPSQVVTDTFMLSGPELPFTVYDFVREVPELGAFGLIGMAACAGLVLMLRTRRSPRRSRA